MLFAINITFIFCKLAAPALTSIFRQSPLLTIRLTWSKLLAHLLCIRLRHNDGVLGHLSRVRPAYMAFVHSCHILLKLYDDDKSRNRILLRFIIRILKSVNLNQHHCVAVQCCTVSVGNFASFAWLANQVGGYFRHLTIP